MNTKLIIILLASLVIITACTEQFQQQQPRESLRKSAQQQEQQAPASQAQATPTDIAAIEEEKPVPTQQTQQQSPQPKKTEAECKKQWQILADAKSSFITMEKGVVELFFKEGITLGDAQKLLKRYQLKFKEIKTIFPTKEPQSAETLFSTYRRIVAEVQPGKEIEVGCKTMQEESIESISPVLKVDINALVKK